MPPQDLALKIRGSKHYSSITVMSMDGLLDVEGSVNGDVTRTLLPLLTPFE